MPAGSKNGMYGKKHTPEWIAWAKQRFTGAGNPMFGRNQSDITKSKISVKATGRKTWASNIDKNDGRFKRFQQAGHDACRGKHSWNYELTKELDARLAYHHEGQFKKDYTPWNRDRIGIYSIERLKKIGDEHRGEKNFWYGKPRIITKSVSYKKIAFKSSWEANIAKKMDELGLFWAYEPKRFEFPHKRFTYLPDFYVFDWGCFLEVKGYYDLQSSMCLHSFQQYTFRNLVIIDRENYKICLLTASPEEFKNACEAFC